MKLKIMTTLIASMASVAMVSCNSDKGETNASSKDGNTESEGVTATASTVSASLAPFAKIFNGEKYVPTKLAHSTDYFIVYFTASW